VGSASEVLSEENLKLLYNINARIVSYAIDEERELKQVIPVSTVTSAKSNDMREGTYNEAK
jgi:iron complex transport system ATP-binding protein